MPFVAGKPTVVSFVIRQPNGKPLLRFKKGPGPHTGVHLIIVRRDLATIVHQHPPIAADGTISEAITFTKPGPYRVVVDVYPDTTGPLRNFQLFGTLQVAGTYVPQKLPPFSPTVETDGYRFTLHGRPNLHAIEADFLAVTVAGPNGQPAQFTPWFGALAHAIFFRVGSLDYFHTHVCAPNAAGCASLLGGTRDHRQLDLAGEAEGRRARARPRHVAALPAVQGRRSHPDRALHVDRQTMNPAKKESSNMSTNGHRRILTGLAVAAVALVAASAASAHARVSPPVSLAKELQLYSLAVPTEKENLTTTKIVLTVPSGFGIDSFAPSPGWKQQLQQTGSGDSAVIQKVTWTGGNVPTGDDSLFQFLAQPAKSGKYTFQVEQTYSDGSIVNWAGSESSDAPAPTIVAKSSLGGGGSSIVSIVGLVIAILALVLAGAALFARGSGGGGDGKRQLA